MSSQKRKREDSTQQPSLLLEPRSSASYSIVFETKRQKKQNDAEKNNNSKWDECYMLHRIRDTLQSVVNPPSVLTDLIMQYVAVPLVYASQGVLFLDQQYQVSLRCRLDTCGLPERLFMNHVSNALLKHTWDMDIDTESKSKWVHPIMLTHERSRFVFDVLLYGKPLDTSTYVLNVGTAIIEHSRQRQLVSSAALAESIALEMQGLAEIVSVSSVSKEWMTSHWLYYFGGAHGDNERHMYERFMHQPLSTRILNLTPNRYVQNDTFHLRCLLSDVVEQYKKNQTKEDEWDDDVCHGYDSENLCACHHCRRAHHGWCERVADMSDIDADEEQDDDEEEEDDEVYELRRRRRLFQTCVFRHRCDCKCTGCVTAAPNATLHNCEVPFKIARGGKYVFMYNLCHKPQVHSDDAIVESLNSATAEHQLALSMALVPMESPQRVQQQHQQQQSMALIVAPSTALVPYRY